MYFVADRKLFPIDTGVYLITFVGSKKVYIGSVSTNEYKIKSKNGFYCRWSKHIYLLRKNNHQTTLQNAYNKYGEENMFFEILEICEPKICLQREQYYINKYDSYSNGYNSRPIAENNKGFKQSINQKNKISKKYRTIRDKYYNDVKNLYYEGRTTREISSILKISRGMIHKIFKENKIDVRSLSDYKKIKIYQFLLNGEFVKEWQSIADCAKNLNFNTHGIQLVLNKKCKHYKGYYFNYEKISKSCVLDNINYFISKSKNIKYQNIKQKNENGTILKVWKNVNEVIVGLGFSTAFYRYLKNNKMYKGYYWEVV